MYWPCLEIVAEPSISRCGPFLLLFLALHSLGPDLFDTSVHIWHPCTHRAHLIRSFHRSEVPWFLCKLEICIFSATVLAKPVGARRLNIRTPNPHNNLSKCPFVCQSFGCRKRAPYHIRSISQAATREIPTKICKVPFTPHPLVKCVRTYRTDQGLMCPIFWVGCHASPFGNILPDMILHVW